VARERGRRSWYFILERREDWRKMGSEGGRWNVGLGN
jgi:hypothetical protein